MKQMEPGAPLELASVEEFLRWTETQTFALRKTQGRLSTMLLREQLNAFQQVAEVFRVPVDEVQRTFDLMRKQHKDPTLSELADRVQADETARLDAETKRAASRLVKEVFKMTLVRKTDIHQVLVSMGGLPSADDLANAVRDRFYNEYPHLRVRR